MWDVFSPVGEMYYILSSFRGNGSGVNKPNKLLSSQALSLYVCVCVLVCLFCMSLSLCACVRGPEVSSLSLFSLVLRYGLSGNLQLILSSLTDQQAPQILLSVCLSVTTPIPQDWGYRCMPPHPTFTWLPGNQTLALMFPQQVLSH